MYSFFCGIDLCSLFISPAPVGYAKGYNYSITVAIKLANISTPDASIYWGWPECYWYIQLPQ
jgi:hypothetical protein